MAKKRILAISHFYISDNRGGGEIMLHEILKRLVKEGYEVDAVATDNIGPSLNIEGVNVYRGKEYVKMLSKKYSLLITQFQNSDHVLPIAEKLKIPTVYIAHNTMWTTKNTLRDNNPTLVVFNTQWVKDYFNYQGDSTILHPPVYREDHATESGSYITMVNLHPTKGVYVMYNLASVMPKNYFLGVKGGYYKDQQVVLKRHNVKIIENTEDMKKDVWQKTRILLMPSEYESYGMVAVEALASGIPVIANKTPGLVESLSYAGIFPRNNSLRAWKSELAKLFIDRNYELASSLARKRSEEINPTEELDAFVKRINKII